jgi:hypothetical protein
MRSNLFRVSTSVLAALTHRGIGIERVPQREQQELITIVGSTKNDIVRPSSVNQR